ncbi:MAG: glycosyltransferase family 4 protein [Vicinamibacterales bacterium]
MTLLVSGDLGTRTGGYGYDREILAGLARLGWTTSICALDASFPAPTADARAQAARALAALPDDALVLADGLAFGVLDREAASEAARLRFVGLVHHPLALENGVPADRVPALVASERRALACTRGVVVTSHATVTSLAPYAVPADRVAVVLPGTPELPIARGSRGRDAARTDAPVALLSVATLTPRKGHDVLIAALARLAHLPWQLTLAGSVTMHPPTTTALREAIDVHGLADRVTFAGDLDEDALRAAYDAADVFVLPTRHEGYGMAIAEAVAAGLPVVATPTGAIPALVDDASGVLVPIDDVDALTTALSRVIGDDDARTALAAGAVRRRDTLPRWADSAIAMDDALRRFAANGIVQR